MAALTQANIDEATLIAKSATYKLAYELAIEKKHGGDIKCCIKKLKLLWLYTRAISCCVAGELNCLTDDKIKNIIIKIKSLCTT